MGKYDDFYGEVKTLPVVDVISSRVALRPKGNYYEALCPFHNDRHLGSFKVDKRRNRWRCYSCGEGGDAVDFVSKFDNISWFQAAVKLGLEYGVCTPAAAEAMLNGETIPTPNAHPPRKKRVIPVNEPRPYQHRAAVYDAFATAAGPLTQAHRWHLLEERHVDGWLQDFFEWPNPRNPAFWRRFAEELRHRGIHEPLVSAIKYVPGFAYDLESNRPYFMSGAGIGIRLHDENGCISGLQLRYDHPKQGTSRYKLFSSGWAEMNDMEAPSSFDGATLSQAPDILFPSEGHPSKAAVTEGRYKGIQLAKRGYLVLSLNGVTNFSLVLPEYIALVKDFGISGIDIYFDADMCAKIGVATAAMKLSQAIRAYEMRSWFVTWDLRLGKGIDDVLLAGHHDKFKRYSSEAMEIRLDGIIQQFKAAKKTEAKDSASA